MKKYTGVNLKNSYALSLTALLISCMLWTGCGMEEASTEETALKIPPLLEQLFSYEVNKNYGNPYLLITGIAEKYQNSF